MSSAINIVTFDASIQTVWEAHIGNVSITEMQAELARSDEAQLLGLPFGLGEPVKMTVFEDSPPHRYRTEIVMPRLVTIVTDAHFEALPENRTKATFKIDLEYANIFTRLLGFLLVRPRKLLDRAAEELKRDIEQMQAHVDEVR